MLTAALNATWLTWMAFFHIFSRGIIEIDFQNHFITINRLRKQTWKENSCFTS